MESLQVLAKKTIVYTVMDIGGFEKLPLPNKLILELTDLFYDMFYGDSDSNSGYYDSDYNSDCDSCYSYGSGTDSDSCYNDYGGTDSDTGSDSDPDDF